MTPLTSMDELQDIEDLVVTGEEEGGIGGAGVNTAKKAGNKTIPITHTSIGLAPAAIVATSEIDADLFGNDGEDDGDKYKKRSSTLMQAVQSCAPSWTGAVPQSMRDGKKKDDDVFDAMEGGGRSTGTPRRNNQKEKKHRRSDPRVVVMALSLLSCVATMFLLYARLSAKLPQT